MPLTQSVKQRIEEWAVEAGQAHDLELFDVVVESNWLVQVFVDVAEPEPGRGVSIDDCARVSRYMEALLDNDERVDTRYTLEVSSPGVERELTKPRHFERSIGRDVRIVVHQPIEKENVFCGRLVAFDGTTATVEDAEDSEGGSTAIEWSNIAKARLTFDFSE